MHIDLLICLVKGRTIIQVGSVTLAPRYSMKLAKPSFNQRSSHQSMVTIFPNHWNRETDHVIHSLVNSCRIAWCVQLTTGVKPFLSPNLLIPYIKYMVSYSSGPKRSSPLCIQRFSRSTGNKYGTLCNMILLLQLISTSRDWADLVGDLVGHHDCHPLLVGGGGLLGVVQHVGFSVRYQTPVFHGSRHKVGDRNHVCLKTSKTLSCCCTKSPIIKNIKSQK